MNENNFDFSDKSLSGEERLHNFVSLNTGLILTFEKMFARLVSYNDLLEEELEASPAAVEYLDRSNAIIAKGQRWVNCCKNITLDMPEIEAFDMVRMVEAVLKRCCKILSNQELKLVVNNDEVVVEGSLFQLQNLVMKSIITFAEMRGQASTPLQINMFVKELHDNFFELMKSNCSGGEYLIISIGGAEEFELQKQTSFLAKLLEEYNIKISNELQFFQMYGVVIAHGGDFFFQKMKAGNSCLNMILPIQGRRNEMLAPHNIEDERYKGSETILLVDDEDMIWDVIMDMLQEFGYTVILAGNGIEAIEIYEANPGEIDLVLLDMVMPKMDGYDTFFRLKQLDSDVKVLLSSGYMSEEDARDVLAAGATGFLQKPYRIMDLAKKIRAILEQTKQNNGFLI